MKMISLKNKEKKVIVITGQTATGKSDWGVKIAKKFNGEVVSADSRQVYTGLNIGTGKVTKKEMRGVLHHLIDVANPTRVFTVAEYQKLARKKIDEILKKGKLPIIVGGTGFYIDVLLGDVTLSSTPPNKLLRKKLKQKTAQELFSILKKIDPAKALTIDKHNPVRLIRAIEIAQMQTKRRTDSDLR